MQSKINSNFAVLFDLDGTLLDTAPDLLYALNILLEQENKSEFKLENILPLISKGSKYFTKEAFGITDENSPILKELWKRYLKIYENTNFQNTNFFPGIENLLNLLDKNNIPWGIVTNKIEKLTYPCLKKFGLENRTNSIICGDTTEFSKPHPLPVLTAAKKLNIEPNKCIFVGDAETDIIAGHKANMKTIAALYGYIESKTKAKETWNSDAYVDHSEELWEAIIQIIK